MGGNFLRGSWDWDCGILGIVWRGIACCRRIGCRSHSFSKPRLTVCFVVSVKPAAEGAETVDIESKVSADMPIEGGEPAAFLWLWRTVVQPTMRNYGRSLRFGQGRRGSSKI